jgi:hypothetical protein
MKPYINLNDLKETLASFKDEVIEVNKFAKIKLLYPHLLELHAQGVRYVTLTGIINNEGLSISVATLRGFMSRIKSDEHKNETTKTLKISGQDRTSPKQTATETLILEEKNKFQKTTEQIVTNLKRDENMVSFPKANPTHPKYDHERATTTVTLADLGLPELTPERKK